MNTRKNMRKEFWLFMVAFSAGICVASSTMHMLSAGPLEVPDSVNKTNEPVFTSATYVPNTLVALKVKDDSKNNKRKPIVIVVGQARAEVVLPGESRPVSVQALGYTYVKESDLSEFPTALDLLKRNEMKAEVLDTSDLDRSAIILRKFYSLAHGLGP